MAVFAVPPPVVDVHGAAARRRWFVVVLAGVSLSAVLTALGVGLVLSHGRAPLAREDRVFEAMVAAPIISLEAETEPAPIIAPIAVSAAPRARRPRPVAAPAPVVKTPPPAVAPRVVAALPREAMPPPFAVVY